MGAKKPEQTLHLAPNAPFSGWGDPHASGASKLGLRKAPLYPRFLESLKENGQPAKVFD